MAGATRRPTRRSWCGCLRLTSVLVAYRRLLGRGWLIRALLIRGLPLGTSGLASSGAASGDAASGDAAPGDAVPGDAVPGDAVPGDAVPGDAAPGLSPRGRPIVAARGRAYHVGRNAPGTVVLCFLRRSRRRRSFAARFVHNGTVAHGRISRGQSRTAILGLSGSLAKNTSSPPGVVRTSAWSSSRDSLVSNVSTAYPYADEGAQVNPFSVLAYERDPVSLAFCDLETRSLISVSQARDQVTLDLHAWRYPGERERLQRDGLQKPGEPGEAYYEDEDRRRGQRRPLDPPSTSPCAVHLPQDRREGRLLEVPGRPRVIFDPVGSGVREAATTGSSSLSSAWQTGQLFRCSCRAVRSPSSSLPSRNAPICSR